jgi:hypothetical protein
MSANHAANRMSGARKQNRPEKIQSPRFWRWIISGLYLLAMVCLMLLTPTGGYGAPEFQPWVVLALIVASASYATLMLWLWPDEKAFESSGGGSFYDHSHKS